MRPSSSLRIALIVPILTALLAPAASAQEKKVGLVVGFPIDVGVFWQASARVALRADVGFGVNTFESTSQSGLSFGSGVGSSITTTSSSGFTTLGLTALFTIRNDDNLRLYVAPRGAIDMTHRSNETVLDPPSPSSSLNRDTSDTTRGHEFDVMFGGQYRLRDRLALFGETGLAYQRSSFPSLTTSFTVGGVTSSSSDRDSRTTFFGLRSTIGLVFFF